MIVVLSILLKLIINFTKNNNFLEYHTVPNKNIQSDSAYSKIIGKGTLGLSFDEDVTNEAYHAQSFSINIISAGVLNKKCKFISTHDRPAKSSASTCIISRRNNNQTVACIEMLN